MRVCLHSFKKSAKMSKNLFHYGYQKKSMWKSYWQKSYLKWSFWLSSYNFSWGELFCNVFNGCEISIKLCVSGMHVECLQNKISFAHISTFFNFWSPTLTNVRAQNTKRSFINVSYASISGFGGSVLSKNSKIIVTAHTRSYSFYRDFFLSLVFLYKSKYNS